MQGPTGTAQDYIQRRGEFLRDVGGPQAGGSPTDLAVWAVENLGHEDWIFREALRMQEKHYTELLSDSGAIKAIPGHFLHMSKKRPGQIAFTPSAEYGAMDRQVTLPISKYLTRYQAELGLGASEANDVIRRWAARNSPVRLYLARTEEDIIYAYAHGPESCMKHDEDLTHDPVRVYAGPDTGVLVMIQGGVEGELEGATVLGRAVCHVERKEYVSTYTSDGFWATQFDTLLVSQGWAEDSGCLKGARLLRIWDDDDSNSLVMPYIDGSNYCGMLDETGQYIVLGRDGFDCQNSSGFADTADDDTEECECCGRSFDSEDLTYVEHADGQVCSSCLDNHYSHAYVGRYQEYVKNEEVYGEDSDGNAYTEGGASYHGLVFPEDSTDTLQSADDLHRTEDGDYYEDIENAENDGYVHTIDERLIREQRAHRTHTEALDGKWVPDDEMGDYGYIMAEDGAVMLESAIEEHGYIFIPGADPLDEERLVSKDDLADYGYSIGATGQLEVRAKEALAIPAIPPATGGPQSQTLAA